MAGELVDRLTIMVAVRRFLGTGDVPSRTLRSDNDAHMKAFVCCSAFGPFRRFHGDWRREFMQRLLTGPYGTLGSCLRDNFQEESVDAVAYLPVPRA
jgi:hypothetical protein